MLKNRNAQGLSIRVIVLAIMGLIVLVVLMVMFSKESGKSIAVLGSCETRGGNCGNPTCGDNEREVIGAKCEGSPYPCCVGI